jgi:glycerophosphoryl diester phosphodiesterase
MNRMPLVIAHRTCRGHAPENTLAGIRKAIEFGADAVEFDVRCTADGVPVLLHDATVDRTTDGVGLLGSLTFAETRSLDASGEPIPSLTEAIETAKERILLFIELKEEGTEAPVVEAIRGQDAVRGCAVHSFLPNAIAAVRRLEPRIPCALLAATVDDPDETLDAALSLNAQGLSVLHTLVDQQLVAKALRRSLRVYCWAVNEVDDMGRLALLGVDGIISDYPDRLLATLRTL